MKQRAQPWLGTVVSIAADCEYEAFAPAFEAVALVHRLMSFHDADSDISRFNRAPVGACLRLHPHTWQVLHLATQMQAASDGIFNLACAPRLAGWRVLPAPASAAPAYEPQQAVFQCLEHDTVRKLRNGWIDAGGVAKGYAVDLAVAALLQGDVTTGCVNAGGDLRVFGDRDWPVSVRDPRNPQRTHTQLLLRNESFATSASYFSQREFEGQQVSALVDGRSGASMTGTASVSVRAPCCANADALTKVVLVSLDVRHPALSQWQASAFII
ncbi:FAD:protein FMN transferase [Duganella sp. FT135W]|uniref:FAD:protein FMN transferase n=1 Tax=Duganella flavida TaxID=2692175 RepID=A0A6L8K8C7_9BURK|nr:FAD:protein FMN transferase [Duganella flavida]MYM22142.1 FAD:protein FMN transferase [Duganella flavida]